MHSISQMRPAASAAGSFHAATMIGTAATVGKIAAAATADRKGNDHDAMDDILHAAGDCLHATRKDADRIDADVRYCIATDVIAGARAAVKAATHIAIAAAVQSRAVWVLSARAGFNRNPDRDENYIGLMKEAADHNADAFYPIPGTPDRFAAGMELFRRGDVAGAVSQVIGCADLDVAAAESFSL